MELFTWAWLGTVAGCTLATVLVTNGLATALGWSARWVALAVALVLSLLATGFTVGLTADTLALGIVNGFVVYTAAVGGNQIVVGRERQQLRMVGERPFFDAWW